MTVLLRNFTLFFSLLISLIAWAGPGPIELPAVNAQFEVVTCDKACEAPTKESWWLFREPNAIEIRKVDAKTNKLAHYSELWHYQAKGQSTYEYLLHDEKKAITYQHDDLKQLEKLMNDAHWMEKSQFFTDGQLVTFKIQKDVKAEPFQGYPTSVWKGYVNGEMITMTWIAKLRVPVKVAYKSESGATRTVTLKALYAGDNLNAKDTGPKTTAAQLKAYQAVKYTDVKNNPDAKKWISKAKAAPGLKG